MIQSFTQGVLVALALALVAGALVSVTPLFLAHWPDALRHSISLIGGLYFAYQLNCSPRKSGRVSLAFTAVILVAAQVAFAMSTLGVVATTLCLLWITRTWLYQRTPLQALLDFGLWVLSGFAAVTIFHSTGSFGLSVWGFFLVQALWPQLAALATRVVAPDHNPPGQTDLLQQLRRATANADAALRSVK